MSTHVHHELPRALIKHVRAAICAEIDSEIRGGWSVPFNLDRVAAAAIRAALEGPPEKDAA